MAVELSYFARQSGIGRKIGIVTNLEWFFVFLTKSIRYAGALFPIPTSVPLTVAR